jgi:hypothetical protein
MLKLLSDNDTSPEATPVPSPQQTSTLLFLLLSVFRHGGIARQARESQILHCIALAL